MSRGALAEALILLDAPRARAGSGPAARWVDSRVQAWLERATEPLLSSISGRLTSGGRIRALVLRRRARLAIRAGRELQARQWIAAAGPGLTVRERMRLRARAGNPSRIGALVPLSGRWQTIGYRILQGMALAAGLVGRPHGRPATLWVRDSGAPLPATLRDLCRAGVVAVVGLPRSGRARTLAPSLGREAVPTIVAADGDRVPALSPWLFRGVHSPAARARALARYAAAHHLRRVGVLHLQGGYGKRTADAFTLEARRLGLRVVVRIAYPRGDKTLYQRFRPLAAQSLQGVFIADSARHLEVVAPQLALAGLGAAPVDRLGRGGVLLLSTAEGLSDRLRRNGGLAVRGAVLAPGFYPDPKDPLLGGFARAYQQAFGRPPGRYAAFGYLTVLRIRSLLVSRTHGRTSLAKALAAPTPNAVPRNGPTGERVDPPLLYEVRAADISRIATPRP